MKMNNNIFGRNMKNQILLAILLVVSHVLAAQTNEGNKKIYNDTLNIVGKYQPKITDAAKLDVVPAGEKMEVTKPTITYTAKSKLLQVETTNNIKLPSLSIIKSPRKDFDHFYIKAGFGNYMNLLIDANYNSTLLSDRALSVRLMSHSGNSTIKYSNAAVQLADISARKDFSTKALTAKLVVDNSSYHYFGFRLADSINTDSIDPKSIRQNYLFTGINFGFNNELEKREKIHYWGKLGISNLYDYYKKNEFSVNFYGKLEQYFNGNPIRFETQVDHFIYSSPLHLNNHRTLFDIKASYIFLRDNWKAELGFDAPTESDTNVTKTHFYPNILLEASLAGSYFNVFGGLRGNLTLNSYYSVVQENPYVINELELRNTNNKFELFGGFKGSAGSKFRYFAQFSYHNLENVLLFVNELNADSSYNQRFTAIYDSSNTTLMRIKIETSISPISNLFIFVGFNYDIYDQNPPEAYPWHIPILQTKLTARYTLQDKITFNLDYFILGKRYARDPFNLSTPIELDPINDLNFGINYKFNKTWSIFFQFNNITNQKYSYWNNYQLRGFNFLVGGKANF